MTCISLLIRLENKSFKIRSAIKIGMKGLSKNFQIPKSILTFIASDLFIVPVKPRSLSFKAPSEAHSIAKVNRPSEWHRSQ